MSDRRGKRDGDEMSQVRQLEDQLRALTPAIAWPTTGPAGGMDLARRVRLRLEAAPPSAAPSWRRWLGGSAPVGRPLRRGLVLALAALLVVAAVAAAIGLGVPGIRILFGPGPSGLQTASVPPTGPATPEVDRPLGSTLGLGTALSLDEAARAVDFEIRRPPVDDVGAPTQAYLAGRRVNLVWAVRPGLPETQARGVGLIVTEFRGRVDPGYYEKQVNGGTQVEEVTVAGLPGYWLSGEPHSISYVDDRGVRVEESRRIVGDVLIWSNGDLTYRLETALGRDEAIRLAESMR